MNTSGRSRLGRLRAIFVSESRVAQISDILETYNHDYAEMGILARQTWNDWFGREAVFHRIVDWCLELAANRSIPERIGTHPFSLSRLKPGYLAHKWSKRWYL